MRFEDWEERLAEAVARHALLPFAWGSSDCFIFPMDVCLALTGTDLAAGVRGYDSEIAALRLLAARGFRDLGEAFASGLPEVAPSFARRGDVGIADYPAAVIGGGVVVLGVDVIGKGETGTVRLPRDRLKRAFKVGWQ